MPSPTERGSHRRQRDDSHKQVAIDFGTILICDQFRNYKRERQLHSASQANQDRATDHRRNIGGLCTYERTDEAEGLAPDQKVPTSKDITEPANQGQADSGGQRESRGDQQIIRIGT